tara:strand:- start:768 stop:1022 length:255 start_codon:yes stop_codon:yes gene_type:complete
MLVAPMERLAANIAEQVAIVVRGHETETHHLVIAKLGDRFVERLGISDVPRLSGLDGPYVDCDASHGDVIEALLDIEAHLGDRQ